MRFRPDNSLRLGGPSRGVLTGERTALNFLQLLSGTASITRQYVDAVAGTECRILDTRKTIPGLRLAQNTRSPAAAAPTIASVCSMPFSSRKPHCRGGSITAAVLAARKLNTHKLLEVEVENFAELSEALSVGVERILLDNFSLAELEQAVRSTHAIPFRNPSWKLPATSRWRTSLRSPAPASISFRSVA